MTRQGDPGSDSPAALPRLSVQLGERYRVGNIFIATEPNPKVSPTLILKAAKEAIPEDKVCTTNLLEDIRARVSQLGTFQEVRVVHGAPDSATKVVPLVVNVRE